MGQSILGRRAGAIFSFRPGHHALHFGRDHPGPAQGRVALPRRTVQGRRGGAAQDQPVHTLRDGDAVGGAGPHDRGFARAYPGAGRRLGGLRSGLELPHHHRAHGHRGLDVRDVDRRADNRTRDRQRHLVDHHGRDRRAPAERAVDHVPVRARGRDEPVRADPDPADRGRRHRRNRLRRDQPAPDPDPVRAARGRTAGLWRAELALAAQDQHRRCHPADLRLVDPGLSGHRGDLPARRPRIIRRC